MIPERSAAMALRVGIAALAWLVAAGTAGASATLESIEFSSLPGDRTEIRMRFDGTPPEPSGYTISSPARIALDLMGVRSALDERYHELGIGNAREVTVVEAQDRTRLVIQLTELVPYESRVEDNVLHVLVGGEPDERGPGEARAVAGAPLGGQTLRDEEPAASDSRIEDVDFRRGEAGDGRVVIRLSDPKAPVNVATEAGRIRVQVRDTALPEELRRRLDVTDFATPVQEIRATQDGPHATFSIRASGNFDYLSYQADEHLTINVTEIVDEERERLDDVFRYQGDRLSLNFQDIEVRSVLQLIADFTDMNLVASDTVTGRITLRLQNVPWDQALDLILRTKGLDKREVGNVLLVAPASEIAARERLELENKRQISELAPLRTEFIQVRYADAERLFNLFDGQGSGNRMLSERGSVIIDDRTNAIILTDTADKLEDFRRVIAQLDVPVRQVLLEARIVTADAEHSRDLGIRWGVSGDFDARGTPVEFGTGVNPTERGLNVDLGVAAQSASRFGIGIARRDALLDLELSALASDGHAEVVARPKVITSDKQAARIEQGVDIPFQEATASGATSTSFRKAVLSLEATPQITPDDRIIMDLNVTQDAPGAVFNGVPSINTNEITTQVLVDDGQTLVLGGIFQTNRSKRTTKTPFFGDIPGIGRLFRRTEERDEKSELLIFITPKIVRDTLAAQ